MDAPPGDAEAGASGEGASPPEAREDELVARTSRGRGGGEAQHDESDVEQAPSAVSQRRGSACSTQASDATGMTSSFNRGSSVPFPAALAATPATKSKTLTRRRSALMKSSENEELPEGHTGARIVQDFAAVHLVDFVQRMLREVECCWDLTPYNQDLETVAVFLDVSGFTKLTERLSAEGSAGSEKLGFFLNRYFERINKLLGKGGGDIMKFAGDAMIVFWQPEHDAQGKLDHKTMACKATQAGLQLQEELHGAELAEGVEFSIKIGIGVGKASILHVGGEKDRIEIVPCGEALLQAFACENQSEAGQTIVSPEVWHLIKENFEGKELASGSAIVRSSEKRVRNVSIKRPALTSIHEIKQLQRYVPASITPFLQTHLSWMSEVREVITIFVNLGLDPRDLVTISPKRLQRVQTIFRTVQREAYRVEASVNKFLVDDKGTTVLVAHGLPPLSNEADPARGVVFALRIVSALRAVDPAGKRYIGVTAGSALCGPVGSGSRKEYTLLGDSVNVSARFMQAAKDPNTNLCRSPGYLGNIVCDQSTRDACLELSKEFVFHAIGEIMLKGKVQATPCYQPGWAALHNVRGLVRAISGGLKQAKSAPAAGEIWRNKYIDALFAIDNFFCSSGQHPAVAAICSSSTKALADTMHLTCMAIWEERSAEPYYLIDNEVVSFLQLHADFRAVSPTPFAGQGSGRNSAARPAQDRSPKWLQHLTRHLSAMVLLRTQVFLGDSLLRGAPVWSRILRGVIALAKLRDVPVSETVLEHACFTHWPLALGEPLVETDQEELRKIFPLDEIVEEVKALLQSVVDADISLILTIECAHWMTPIDWEITQRVSKEFLSRQQRTDSVRAYQARMQVVEEQVYASGRTSKRIGRGKRRSSFFGKQPSNSDLLSTTSHESSPAAPDGERSKRRSSGATSKSKFSGVFLLVSMSPVHPLPRRPKFGGLQESYVGFMQSMQTIVIEHRPLTLLQSNSLIMEHLGAPLVSPGLTKTLFRITGGVWHRLKSCLEAMQARGMIEGLATSPSTAESSRPALLRRSSSGLRLTRRPSQNVVVPADRARLPPMSFREKMQLLALCSDSCNTRWEAQVIDGLTISEKILLRCASVLAFGLGPFGLHFDLGMLAAIYPFKEVDRDVQETPSVSCAGSSVPPEVSIDDSVLLKLESRLQRLLQMGVIQEVHRPKFNESNVGLAIRHEDYCPYMRVKSSVGETFEASHGSERCYRFCDVIMRRKVYREMLLAHRKRLHQAAIQLLQVWSEALSLGQQKLRASHPIQLQVQVMTMFHLIGAKQMSDAHKAYSDTLKKTLELRLPSIEVKQDALALVAESVEPMSVRKKHSMPRLLASGKEPSGENKSAIWASVRRRPSSMLSEVLSQSFYSNGGSRRESGLGGGSESAFAAIKEDSASQFAETLRSIRQSTRRASILRAPSIRTTISEGALLGGSSLDESRSQDYDNVLARASSEGSVRPLQAAAAAAAATELTRVPSAGEPGVPALPNVPEAAALAEEAARAPWWARLWVLRTCLGSGFQEGAPRPRAGSKSSTGLRRGPSTKILSRLPSMNVGFMKPTVDNDWDEVLEEPATESASKENLYAYMRRVSGNGEVQAQNTPANHGSGGGGRFTMRGMRWSARVSAARSSGNQSVERRVASADQHDEAREKLSSSFKLRSARSSTLTDTFERSVAPLISETHALYIYSHRTAVDTWSRRMNFQERDAMSALALQLDSWSFDIFAFERVACGTPLHMMMRLLFLKHGFYELFEFDIKMVDRFAKEVERLYPANPYHNSTHAADVVQACHVFLLQLQHRKLVLCESAANVFGRPMPSKSSDDYISSSFAEGTPARKGSLGNETADDADDEKEEEAPVTPEFDKLDRLAMLLAAAVHDIGHPGVNASFLKATGNSLCQQFPDPVLEQFHAATARPLIEALLVGELANVRAYVQPLVTQLVLSTSVENHTAFVDTLNQRMDTLANPSGASAVEHQQSFRSLSTLDSQRSSGCLLLTNKDAESMMMELIIKCADVSNCARELPTYKLWVTRITEEFTGQTELERHMGVPVTTFMAHFDPQMQLGFINNIAFPLFDVLARLCPEATLQRDYVLANYMFYQKGKDTSSPGVSRADAQAVSEDPTRQLLVQEESRESRSSHEKGKLTSEVLLRSASNIALASSALSRSSTASMKVRPLFSAKHGAGNKSASVIFTTPLNLDPLESMHSKSVDALRASLPGMVVEEEEQAGPAGKAAVESPESPLSCK